MSDERLVSLADVKDVAREAFVSGASWAHNSTVEGTYSGEPEEEWYDDPLWFCPSLGALPEPPLARAMRDLCEAVDALFYPWSEHDDRTSVVARSGMLVGAAQADALKKLAAYREARRDE